MFAVSLEAGISLRFRGRNRARMDLSFPETDPTPIFDAFRSIHATELLTAAVAHLTFVLAELEKPTVSSLLVVAVAVVVVLAMKELLL